MCESLNQESQKTHAKKNNIMKMTPNSSSYKHEM